jgi:D-sedoheptulose 7-phosphate isomerase
MSPDVDMCFTVRSQSVHRIQEAQALVGYALWTAVHEQRGAVISPTTITAAPPAEEHLS